MSPTPGLGQTAAVLTGWRSRATHIRSLSFARLDAFEPAKPYCSRAGTSAISPIVDTLDGMKRGSFAALFVVVALAVGSARADQRLILVGGGDRPLDAMQRFVDWAGGHDAKLLIISWATEYPAESLAYFHEQIDPLHPASIEQAPTQPLTAESRA